MIKVVIVFVSFILFGACFSPRTLVQKQVRDYQQGNLKEDTSFVYQLPFTFNTKHRMVQGYYSRFTHKSKAAIDFKMKPGTPILASRSGKVVRIKEDSDQGGWNKKYRPDANFIVIEHDDSTRSSYRHLQYQGVLVELGEKVQQGQLIGYSGNTGYTASPHLHFMVSRYESNQWVTIPTRFKTQKGDHYLYPLQKYLSFNGHPTEEKNTLPVITPVVLGTNH